MPDTNVGSAYIEVEAKLKDGAGKELQKDVEKIDGKAPGKKVGEEVGEGVKGGIGAKAVVIGNILSNVIMAGAKKAMEAVGAVIGGAFTNAANFEQLAGGVEKIFDQANISGIMTDAANAYKDLNMSANDYLSAINQTGATFAQTMGDQKGYDVARTGMLAIADYASGTGRSVDELTEKFSMITRATSSYQSIADQFSGILPATSADFLAQAQAAGYLSDEYTKLTDVPVAEYQEAVSLMLQKGVADMGLAGNTAAESASTISGSIAMLKASWENWLTAVGGGGDLSAATDNLVSSLSTMLENAVPELGTIIGNIIKGLPQLVSTLLAQLPSLATNLMDALFGEGAGDALTGVFDALAPIVEQVGGAFGTMAQNLAPVVQTMWPALQQLGGAIGGLLLQILQILGNLISAALPYITQFLQWVAPYAQTFIGWLTTGIQFITGLLSSQGVELGGLTAIIQLVGGVFETVAGAISSVWGGLVEFFRSIPAKIQGFFATIGTWFSTKFGEVKQAIVDKFQEAVDFVRGIPETILGFFQGIGQSIGDFFGDIHIPLPYFAINPPGWQFGDLLKGSIPSLSVEWHASGGIVDGATLIGAGEAGREAIIPLENQRAMQPFAAAVADDMQDGGTLADVLAVLIQIRDKSADVYIDRDKIGRAMAPNINARIGNNAVMVSRGGGAYAF